MRKLTNLRRWSIPVAMLVIGGIAWSAFGAPRAAADRNKTSDNIVQGVTKPFAQSKKGVNQLGTVLELPIREGQVVKKGDLLLRQDDREERAELARLELEANSTVRIEAADADLKIKEVQYQREVELAKNGNASPTEVEEALSKKIYADAQAKIARLETEKSKHDADKQRFKVDKMTLKADIDGIIEHIDVEVGDTTDPQKPMMSIVQNNPLKVEFFLTEAQSAKLQLGTEVNVRYPTADQWMPAKVTFKTPYADPASGTQKIGLELPNPQGEHSGQQVQIRLPDAPAAAASAK